MSRKTTWKRSGEWLGGYKRQRVDVATGKPFGPELYIIERWVGGVRFHVSTRATSRDAALKQLMRFESDPSAYSPAGTGEARPELCLTAELVAGYTAHQEAEGLSEEYVQAIGLCLARWTEEIGHLDLRRVKLRELRAALDKWPKARAKHIKAIRGFYRWLRTERGLVTHAEDATLDLPVPQSKPEKWKRRKVTAPEDVQAVLGKLPPPFADILLLQTATAWHLTEVRRFACDAGELVPSTREGVLAVLMTRHKSGELTRTPLVHVEHVQAAERLQAWAKANRWPSRVAFMRTMKKSCAEAGVPYFGLGSMRHSVLTWAHEDGAAMTALAEFAHHKSTATTRRFYVDAAVPTGVIPLKQFQR